MTAAAIPAERPSWAVLFFDLTKFKISAASKVGPTLKGLYGKREEVLVGGASRTVRVDEARLRLAIREPLRELVKGYPPVMPSIPLTDRELTEVVTYIKTLK